MRSEREIKEMREALQSLITRVESSPELMGDNMILRGIAMARLHAETLDWILGGKMPDSLSNVLIRHQTVKGTFNVHRPL